MPQHDVIARGFRPNLSDANAITMVVVTRMTPIMTALKNSSMAMPASTENLAAYTNITKIPQNCCTTKKKVIMAKGL